MDMDQAIIEREAMAYYEQAAPGLGIESL